MHVVNSNFFVSGASANVLKIQKQHYPQPNAWDDDTNKECMGCNI
jgi:hypothetical protein